MVKLLTSVDKAVSATRPLWAWLGQLALIVLGVHLAADQLDDWIYSGLTLYEIPWPSSDGPRAIAATTSLIVELAVVVRAAAAVMLTPQRPEITWKGWARRWSIEAVCLPLFWVATALAGAWVVAMAVQDVIAPYDPLVALILSWVVALLVVWRLGWTGLRRVVGALDDPPRSRLQGWWQAPFLLGLTWLALWDGLPIWGWLP